MVRSRPRQVFVVGMILVAMWPVRPARAQSGPALSGQAIFRMYCSACHGASAKGDGPVASVMSTRPPDLTLIANRNGGKFSSEQVAQIIDGRRPVKGHGGGDMPVWGDAFAKTRDAMPADEKIRRLVTYLESIQVRP